MRAQHLQRRHAPFDPQNASAASLGCPTASVKEAVSDLGDICGGRGGSGTINCSSDGSWDWTSVSCN